MTFTKTLWAETAALQDAIRDMPFNAQLADGTLPPETFRRYVIQDAHYLEGFGRALALTAAKADGPDAVAQLASSAAGAIAVERELHAHYMGLYGVDADTFATSPPSQDCAHYVAFLLSFAATASFATSVAALLPCFWVYREVGRHIRGAAAPDNPYRAWIDTYSGEDFSAAVDRMLILTDRLADEMPIERPKMQAAFARSTLHEWLFWDSAYAGRTWPDPLALSAT